MERCSFRKCSPGYDHDNDEWSKQYAPKLTNAFAPCIVPGASNFGGNIDLSGYLGADEKAARKALLHCLWTYECAAAYCAPPWTRIFTQAVAIWLWLNLFPQPITIKHYSSLMADLSLQQRYYDEQRAAGFQ